MTIGTGIIDPGHPARLRRPNFDLTVGIVEFANDQQYRDLGKSFGADWAAEALFGVGRTHPPGRLGVDKSHRAGRADRYRLQLVRVKVEEPVHELRSAREAVQEKSAVTN